MEQTDLEKQVNNKTTFNRNSTGVGGFGEHGENINRNGRPKSGLTWREILLEVGETHVSQSDLGSKSYKEAVALKLWEEAVKGNLQAIKLLFERMDGYPTAKFINKDEEMQNASARLRAVVDSLLED